MPEIPGANGAVIAASRFQLLPEVFRAAAVLLAAAFGKER